MKDKDFEIILSKNRLARYILNLHKDNKLGIIPDYIYYDFEEIEKKTGTANQPDAKEILDSRLDV